MRIEECEISVIRDEHLIKCDNKGIVVWRSKNGMVCIALSNRNMILRFFLDRRWKAAGEEIVNLCVGDCEDYVFFRELLFLTLGKCMAERNGDTQNFTSKYGKILYCAGFVLLFESANDIEVSGRIQQEAVVLAKELVGLERETKTESL